MRVMLVTDIRRRVTVRLTRRALLSRVRGRAATHEPAAACRSDGGVVMMDPDLRRRGALREGRCATSPEERWCRFWAPASTCAIGGGGGLRPSIETSRAARASELLAREYEYLPAAPDRDNLLRVAQYAQARCSSGRGAPPPGHAASGIFRAQYGPTSVHRFLADVPRKGQAPTFSL